MPRPERSLDPAAGPVESLAAELRDLRRRAGSPRYRELAQRAGYSVTALANAAGGRQLPSLAVTLAFVRSCGGDPALWERRWRHAAAQLAVLKPRDLEGDGDRPGGDPPYRGLAGYAVDDADCFFGRTRLVTRLVELVGEHRFVAVFGMSGSGKSSLLRAGLIPAIKQGGAWLPLILTPGAEPLTALRRALAERPPERDVLLVVDQFEEVFTLCRDDAERRRFVAGLAALVDESHVVIAVRADFYARCAELPQLAELLAGANIPVGPLSEDELRQVVTEPARQVGLSVERALVTKILADATGQAGALPLVSHALLETWRQRRSDVLTVSGYEAAGGVGGAIAQTAEAVYGRLDADQRETTREVLTRLVALSDSGVPDTRRRVDRDELAFPGVDLVLHELAAARLLVLDQDTVEIAHEALIEAWPRLHGWLHVDREALLLHRQLVDASKIWHSHERDPGALYRGARLAAWDGRGLERLNPLERTFLIASREREAREVTARRRRVRLALTSLVAGVVLTSLLAGAALIQARRAGDQRDLALSRQLVATARDQLQIDQEVAVLLAREAYDTKPTEEAQAVLRQAVADSRVRTVLASGQGQVFGVAYSPDGRRVASSGADGTVRVWKLGRDTPRVLRGHRGHVWSPVFSRDGRWLAACGVDGTVTVWNLATDDPPVVLRGHGGVVSNVAFSVDGTRLASAGDDGTVRVWDRAGRKVPLVLRVQGDALGVAFSPDGKHLAASGERVWIWNVTAPGKPRVLAGHEGSVENIAFSPDGRRLASGSSDGTVRVWSTTGGGAPLVLRAHDGTVETVAFSPDGQRVASGHSGSDTIRVWNATAGDGDDPLVLRGHDGPVWSLMFSPDGRRLASGSGDGTVRLWDPALPGDPVVLRGHDGPVWSVAVSRDGSRVASGGEDGTVRLWQDSRPLVLRGHSDEVLSVALSPDGSRVASASRDRTVRIWDAADGSMVAVLRGHDKSVWSVAFSSDGKRVATGSTDGTVRIWSADGRGAPVVLRGHESSVASVAFSPDGQRVASASQDGTMRIWNADGERAPVAARSHPGLVWRVAFAPDGRRVATGGDDGNIRLWDSDGRGDALVLRGHRGPAWSIAFSRDGQRLASSGHDGSLRIWQVPGGREVGRELVAFRGHGAFVEQVEFAGDGRQLVAAVGDGTVRMFRCDVCGTIGDVRALADTRVTRTLTADERAALFLEDARTLIR